MHLKSLTLRGFKSFADPTTLQFEPGVTVVVGPNGSGKSNVVDAVAWVLGAQGPRVVRSARMDDVIFAGTAKRPALGRAEVTLTIDNSSRRLPVDLAEVTITRTLFRTGESEYSLNGASCRLLDIQELLSDAGVGRQQHVIMSQGQLASVLDARPEDRRAVIEEAAGILKFRRRRERAERRLSSTEGNLLRLQDLLREVRRQLRPLERQAEAARRHGSLAAELRGLRLYVAGRELESLQARTDQTGALKATHRLEQERLGGRLAELDRLVATSEAALSGEQASEVMGELSVAERLHERARGVANVVGERRRRVDELFVATAETDVVSSLDAESARLGIELRATDAAAASLQPERDELERRSAELGTVEKELGSRAARGFGAGTRALAIERREARDLVLSELSAARETLARCNEQKAAMSRQGAELAVEITRLDGVLAELGESLSQLRGAQVAAESAEREAAEAVTASENAAREAVERAQGLQARAEALRIALDEARARAGVEHLAGRPGVLGTLLDIVEVDAGYERAFEAAVDEALAAVVVNGRAEARAAIEHLHGLGLAGAVLAIADPPRRRAPGEERATTSLRSHLRGTRVGADELLDELLEDVLVCRTGLRDALELAVASSARSVVVTTDGDRLSARGWRLGAGGEGATRVALEAVDDAVVAADRVAVEARKQAEEARAAWSASRQLASEASRAATAVGAEERQAAAQRAATGQRATELGAEAERTDAAQARVDAQVRRLTAELAEREAELTTAEKDEIAAREIEHEALRARRDLEDRARELAAAWADLQVRSAATTERRRVLTQQRSEVERRLVAHGEARDQAAERRRRHEATALALSRIGELTTGLLAEIGDELAALQERRRRHDEAVARITERLTNTRRERTAAERELLAVREQAQRNELERAELRVRLEAALETIRHDLDVEIEECLAASCPELPPGTPPAARVQELERELRLLGPINPLALEELAGLEERDRFLSGQLEDVRSTRRDLGRVIKAVDEEIVSVFTEAFADVRDHFEHLFATLFPGGSGQLSLLEPDDLLSSGIEIEARPAGRNVRRLSLLSGGERSLVALAFLFSVFRSRPSPFYLMDEVEAALDDVNLHRFLDLVDEFREEAQLVIVSHQKRTMESADVIYGVTMQPGGASKVVSERLRGEAAASA
ncbi:MAG: chromosome segregation protein SMC [Acidimicrobiales bacterium]